MLRDTENENLGDGSEPETIRVFLTHEAADIAAATLRANGIECWIMSDDAGGILPNLTAPGGVRLLVNKASASEAKALLSCDSGPTSPDPSNT